MSQEAVQDDEGGKAGGGNPDEREKKEEIAFAARCLHPGAFIGSSYFSRPIT
jgi:hypothetical protein